MPLRFEVFGEKHLPAVLDFNRRMQAGNAASEFLLPTAYKARAAPPDDPIHWENYLVLDGEFVRGGLLAMEQPGWVNGSSVRAWNFQSPLSESIVDAKYSIVAMQMVKFMQKQADAVFMVGMGGADRPLPRLLVASGWSVRPVPFLFRVHRAANFLRELQMLRTSTAKSIAAQVAGFTGLGALALAVKQRRKSSALATVRQVSQWGDWADEIWNRNRENCSFAVLRDRRTLESLYPPSDLRTRILLVERGNKPVGWSVFLNSKLSNDRHFGSLQVGSILDCLADVDAMTATAILTDSELAKLGADLVLVNHSHAFWVEAFRAAGFLTGPSNYMLAMSKKLTEALSCVERGEERVHVTRGDGDGRIHLA
jgi:hypothetical protein